ncbi:MAG TPA: hypothetical protein VIV12_05420 [Streptosporangiaceae bacterium]
MIASITLSDPARGLSSVVWPRAGIAYQGHEVTAAVREVAQDSANADGQFDTTQWLSSAAVTLNLVLYSGTRALLDEIAQYLLPWTRPYLIVDDGEWAAPRRIQLRFDSHSHPIETGVGAQRKVQYAWKAPRGLWEDTARQVFEIAADVPDTTGLAFTAAAGVAVTAALGYRFPASTASGDTLAAVGGNARPDWKAKLYGPAVGPKLSRDDTGQSVVFKDSLVLQAGQYVELDSAALSALLLSDPDASRLADLDFGQTKWFPLDPGVNKLRYHATSGTAAGSVCELTVTPVWMP